jgi:hypothetical protein
MIYEPVAHRPDLFTNFAFDDPLIRFDQEILGWVQANAATFRTLDALESKEANNRIWLFDIVSTPPQYREQSHSRVRAES